MFTRAFNATIGRAEGRNTIIPLATDTEMVRGVGPFTFARASSQYMQDFENRLRKAASGKGGFPGLRLVENVSLSSNNITSYYTFNAGALAVSPNTVSVDSTSNAGIRAIEWSLDAGAIRQLPRKGTFRFTCDLKLSSESPIPSVAFNLDHGNCTVSGTIPPVVSLTEDWVPYSALVTVYAVSPTNGVWRIWIYRPGLSPSGNFDIRKIQIEDVTNQSNQNPSEYVPTTTTSAQQWFDYLNPNTVDANGVVTDSGVRTPITTGKGLLIEPPTTNKCTCYGVPRADALGSELIVNAADREFSSDTGFWTKTDASITISGGLGNFTSAPADKGVNRAHLIAVGKYATITYTIVSLSSGGIRIWCGLPPNGTIRSAPGTYTETLIVAGDGTIRLYSTQTGTTATIDNISVKEAIDYVGTKAYHNGTTVQNPITGMTLSGDTAAVLSIVTDQAAIEAAGLAKQTNGYKLYSVLTGAGGAGVVDFTGLFSAVTTSMGIRARLVSGSATLSDNTGANSVAISGSAFGRLKKENFTAVAGRNARLTVAANSQVIFAIQQVENQPYLTSDMPTLGATASRAAITATLPRAGNLPATGTRHMALEWTPWGSVTGITQCLWACRQDDNNYVAVWANNAIVYGEKRVAGVSEFVTFALTPTLLQTYEIDFYIWPDNTMGLFVDGVSAGSGFGTELLTTPQQQFDSGWLPTDASAVMTGGKGAYTNAPEKKGLYLPNISTIGKLYKLGITIDSITSGGIALRPGEGEQGPTYTIPGTYSVVLFATLDQNMRVYAEGVSTTAVVDNATCIEIYNNSTTLAPVLGSLIEFGAFNNTTHCFGQIKNIETGKV